MKPDLFQHILYPLYYFFPWKAQYLKRNGHIVKDGPFGKEFKVLEYNSYAPTQIRDFRDFEGIDSLTVYQYLAAGRSFFAIEEFKKGCLAGAACPGNKNKLTLFDGKVDVGKGCDALAVSLVDADKLDHKSSVGAGFKPAPTSSLSFNYFPCSLCDVFRSQAVYLHEPVCIACCAKFVLNTDPLHWYGMV